jgi:hypothetical protein
MSFNFSEWQFECESKGDGTRSGNTFYLKDIIDEKNVFFVKNSKIPIIDKHGVDAIRKWAGLKMVALTPMDPESTAEDGRGLWVGLVVTMKDDEGNLVIDTGEACGLSTDPGIGRAFLLAVAKKRAISRAVISYLGIEALGEEEAKDLRRVVSDQELSQDELSNLKEPMAKEVILGSIKEISAGSLKPDEMKVFCRRVLGIAKDEPMKLGDVTPIDLIKIAASIMIDKKLGADALNDFIA